MYRIGNTQVWVHDQDEALEFYTKKLGMEVRSDVTMPELGDFRWLTVAPAGQDDFAIVLMAIPGPPVFDAETAGQIRDPAGQGHDQRRLPHDRRLPEGLRGTGRTWRGVPGDAGGAAVRHRRWIPRPVREQLPPHAGQGPRVGVGQGGVCRTQPDPSQRWYMRTQSAPPKRYPTAQTSWPLSAETASNRRSGCPGWSGGTDVQT